MFNDSVIEIYKDRCRVCLDDSGVDVLRMKNKDKMLELLTLASGINVSTHFVSAASLFLVSLLHGLVANVG